MNWRKYILSVFTTLLWTVSAHGQMTPKDSLYQQLQAADSDSLRAVLEYKFTNEIIQQHPDSVFDYLKDALRVSQELNYQYLEVKVLKNYGLAYFYKNEFPASIGYYLKALEKAKATEHPRYISTTLDDLCILYYYNGENRKAITHLEELLAVNIARKEPNDIGSTLYKLGTSYHELGELKKGLDFFVQALEQYEITSNQYGIAGALNNIGLSYFSMDDYSKAIHFFQLAVKINEEIERPIDVVTGMVNLSNCHRYMGNMKKAEEYALKGLSISEEIDDKETIGRMYSSLAGLYDYKGDTAKVEEYLLLSLQLMEDINNKRGITYNSIELSMYYADLGNAEKAKFYQDKGVTLAIEIEARDYLLSFFDGTYKVYAKDGDYANAYKYLKSYMALKDTLYNLDKTKELLALQTQYETTRKEQDNRLLSKENEITKEQNKLQEVEITRNYYFMAGLIILMIMFGGMTALYLRQNRMRARQKTVELEQKSLRAQMNPHFIFNSLNSIQNFFLKNEDEKANEYLADFGELMRNILDNSNRQRITISEEIKTLELYLSLEELRLEGKFSYEIEIDEQLDVYQLCIPPLIIQPFVENAIWHGILPKKTMGSVKVSLHQVSDNLVQCKIEDDGIGVEKSKTLKQGQQRKRESRGMNITRERLNLLLQDKTQRESVVVEEVKNVNGETTGTLVSIYFPKDEKA
jgi:sensor histidine kinase YesM